MTDVTVPTKVRGGPFSELLRRGDARILRKPPRVVELPLTCWADGHQDKPAAPTPIGLRVATDEEERRASAEADKAIAVFAPDGDVDAKISAYNSALIVEIVACSTCQSADVTQPFFEMASLDVRRRLTSQGIQRIWQELQTLRASSEPAMPELTVEGLAHLTAILDRGIAFEHMPAEEAKRLRRLLEHVRISLAEAEERAERSGVAIIDFGTPRTAQAEPRSDIESVLAALERRKKLEV